MKRLDSYNYTKYLHSNQTRFIAELKDFIRFPSISARPEHAGDVKRCASWLARQMRVIGLERVQVVSTKRHPIVYGEWLHVSENPTVLVYGHYDVQPPEPLDRWYSPPFEPEVRGRDLYGRGASDDKGQLFAHLKALEAYFVVTQRLPVNIKCIFEGEEEIGSPNLGAFLQNHRDALMADVTAISDTAIPSSNQPAITHSLRGMLSLELEVHGPKQDLHSGIFGGAVYNPVQALCETIAQLQDTNGHIKIPGFYNRVRLHTPEERTYMERVGPSDTQILHNAQSNNNWGEQGFSLYERTTIRPALNVTGIMGGYGGDGPKAVIPSQAVAKIEFRLVPDQDPREIEHLFRQYIAKITPSNIHSVIRTFASAKPVCMNRRLPAMRFAAAAYKKGFGISPVFLRSGGTIPVVNLVREILGIEPVLMGFGLPDDKLHSPNEKFHLPNYFKGIMTCISFFDEVGQNPQLATFGMQSGDKEQLRAV